MCSTLSHSLDLELPPEDDESFWHVIGDTLELQEAACQASPGLAGVACQTTEGPDDGVGCQTEGCQTEDS